MKKKGNKKSMLPPGSAPIYTHSIEYIDQYKQWLKSNTGILVKNKVGAPKKESTKKHMAFRLSDDVIKVIRSKKNQVEYIESLVRSDNRHVTKPH